MAAVSKTSIPLGWDDCEKSGTMKQVAKALSNKVRLLVYPYLFNGCPFFYHYNHSSEFDLNLRCIDHLQTFRSTISPMAISVFV